jgi:hypothetical protein
MEAFGKLAKEGVAFEGLDGSKVRSRLAGEGALDIGGVYCLPTTLLYNRGPGF